MGHSLLRDIVSCSRRSRHTHPHTHTPMYAWTCFFVYNYVIRMHFCMYVNIHRVYVHTHTAQNTHTSTLTSHKTLKISSIMSHILSLLVQSKHCHGWSSSAAATWSCNLNLFSICGRTSSTSENDSKNGNNFSRHLRSIRYGVATVSRID